MRITEKMLYEKAKNVGLQVMPQNGYYTVIKNRNGHHTLASGTARECWNWLDGYGDARYKFKDNADYFKMLSELCGHVQDGSFETVRISQDDATRTFHIDVGAGRVSYSGKSLKEAVKCAILHKLSSAEFAELIQ